MQHELLLARRESKLRRRVYEILETASPGDTASAACDIVISSLIILNVLAMIIETVEPIGTRWHGFFTAFEFISVLVFMIEYVLRVWSSVENPEYQHPIHGRLKFASTPLAIIDLLAFLPYYLSGFVVDIRSVRALRLVRIARLAKLGRYSVALQTLGRVVASKKEELAIAVSFMIVLLILASSFMYFAEHEIQPDAFGSIPAAMWWSVATLTTVGYGDVTPVTWVGKILGSVVAMLGVGMFALPTGIVGAGFIQQLHRTKNETMVCPHCGKEIRSGFGIWGDS